MVDKKELLKLLSELSPEELESIMPKKKRRRGKGKRKKNRSANKPSASEENKFDDMLSSIRFTDEEKRELEEATKVDDEADQTKSVSARPAASTVEVTCCTCNKKFIVSPSVVFSVDRWKCNACITGR